MKILMKNPGVIEWIIIIPVGLFLIFLLFIFVDDAIIATMHANVGKVIIKTINGRKGIILTISGVDTASSHSKNGTHFKLFVKNFLIVTSDNRMLTITVTERFPQASGVMNHAAVDAFFKAVKLK
jgi:hypothetical protein